MENPYDDAFMACADLAVRAGASGFEFGYMNAEAESVEDAQWWASASYKGAKLFVGDRKSPAEAGMALAERILQGGTCRCGEPVALSDSTQGCRWRLMGKRWEPSCDAPPIEVKGERGDYGAIRTAAEARMPNRAQRRAAERGRHVEPGWGRRGQGRRRPK
jgi:hypothetical protein